MNKYKICVYAICKNEEKFINRWCNSVKEADEIYVLDTGSTDNSVDLLTANNVNVTKKIISPWRFDVARNESLKLLPDNTDICVCCDLDEVFEKGWRKKMEDAWDNKTTRLRYTFNWLLDENDIPKVTFYYEKTHSRHDYKWIHPVHEVLENINDNESFKTADEIILNHYPDITKSRSNYLPLLELAVKENPDNDRNMHYLGREYMYHNEIDKSIDTLIKHIYLKSATWNDEKCASMRFIARNYQKLNRYDEARMWLKKAIDIAPHLRDPYVELALMEYKLNNYKEVYKLCYKALEINEKYKSYINEVFSWDHTIYDLLSICYFERKDYKNSLVSVEKAIEINNRIDRLHSNKKIIEKFVNKKMVN